MHESNHTATQKTVPELSEKDKAIHAFAHDIYDKCYHFDVHRIPVGALIREVPLHLKFDVVSCLLDIAKENVAMEEIEMEDVDDDDLWAYGESFTPLEVIENYISNKGWTIVSEWDYLTDAEKRQRRDEKVSRLLAEKEEARQRHALAE